MDYALTQDKSIRGEDIMRNTGSRDLMNSAGSNAAKEVLASL